MAIVEVRTSLWEALAGRAPGQRIAPADLDVWRDILERLNPARAQPRLRDGVEAVQLTTVRGVDYVMLRSPDHGESCYQRVSTEEYALVQLMDGSRTVGGLVAEFLRISGRLSPDQVRRVVAELGGNRMLDELPVDAFAPLHRLRGGSFGRRFGRGLLGFVRGRRMVLGNIDPLVTVVYWLGGRLLFTRPATIIMSVVALTGFGVFGWTWVRGAESVFLVEDSYALGALSLLGLNMIALCSHELGHALAAKHAGRKVPAAGFLLYFGIPSAFVDTTDVWMAGRRARLRTTAAGPGAALTLAGAAQLVGLAYPALGALCFKLSFAWYLNSVFNLNPLMALDGYYLLMDWFEVPNLRTRGIAFLVLTFRGRRPKWSTSDREGKFIALYGVLALLWLLIALNLAYRLYRDRVSGLVTGLWHTGPVARALLVAVVAGLAAPLVYALAGWLARRARRVPLRVRELRRRRDLPHRVDLLRGTVLGALPDADLTALARNARWLHPRSGTPLIVAGGAPRAVYVVADGTMEARVPTDPAGSIRQRASAGDLVGTGAVLAGVASPLTWTTAGTTLLALPAADFMRNAGTTLAGTGTGDVVAERAELDRLLYDSAALADASERDRLTLVALARPLDLAPGEEHRLDAGAGVAIVEAGVLASVGGAEMRRGDVLIAGETALTATARTRARMWTTPVAVGSIAGGPPVRSPAVGVHPTAVYPPLHPTVGPPPVDDGSVDRRLRRAGRWLALLLLFMLLLASAANTKGSVTWTEMPHDRALLTVVRGTAAVVVRGTPVQLERTDRRYVGRGDAITVGRDSTARLTFRGGAETVLCASSRVRVGTLYTVDAQPVRPYGELLLTQGLALTRTASASGAFAPLAVRVDNGLDVVANDGAASFAVAPGALAVASGRVTVDGQPQPVGAGLPACGGPGIGLGAPGSGGGGSGSGAGGPGATPGLTPDPGPSQTPDLTAIGVPTRTGPAGTTVAPPPNSSPVIAWVRADNSTLAQSRTRSPCPGGPASTRVVARVQDAETSAGNLIVTMSYSLAGHSEVAGTVTMQPVTRNGPEFSAVLGPITYTAGHAAGGPIIITVRATDAAQAAATPKTTTVTLAAC